MILDPHKLAKKNNPLTSHLAANSVHEFASCHFEAILVTLAVIGNGTPSEIARESTRLGIKQLDKHQVTKRMRQLAKAQKVRQVTLNGFEVTRKEPEPFAKAQTVWELVNNG